MIDQAKVLFDLRMAGPARARSLALDEVRNVRATLSLNVGFAHRPKRSKQASGWSE
jgi:hypothetical protein